jgi:hypothetical protein
MLTMVKDETREVSSAFFVAMGRLKVSTQDAMESYNKSVEAPFFKSNVRGRSLYLKADSDALVLVFDNVSMLRDESPSVTSRNTAIIGNRESFFVREMTLINRKGFGGPHEPLLNINDSGHNSPAKNA